MSQRIQLTAGSTVRRVVTTPASWAPYFPTWHDEVGPTGLLYSRGEFAKAWSPSAQGYADASLVIIEYRDDGTWETYALEPYRRICGGTWSYVP